MADELQALLDRIDRDGIRRGEEEAARIITQAKTEADQLVADAKAQSARMISDAQEECATMKQKSEEALRQSGRQILLEVRNALAQRVGEAARQLLHSVMNADAVAPIIAGLCQSYFAREGATGDLNVLVPPDQLKTLEESVKAQLAADLRKRVNLAPSRDVAGGFKLAFSGNDVEYDFSDEALTEAISAHLSPALGAIISRK